MWLLPSPFEDEDDEDDDEPDVPWAGEEGYEQEADAEVGPTRSRHIWMGVLPDNELALAIYRGCQFTVAIGMGGAVFVGISAVELEGALRLAQVPADEWEDVKWRVRAMERAATPVLNKPSANTKKRGG